MGDQVVFGRKNTNSQRIKKDEEEIAALEQLTKGRKEEPEADEESEEVEQEVTEETNEVEEPEQPEEESEELSKEEKTYKKRYGDLRRHTQQVESELKKEIDSLKTRLDNTEALTLPTSDEDLEAWSSKYPDIAAIVKTLAAKEADKLFSKAKVDIEDIRKSSNQANIEKARSVISKVHNDFEELENSDEFHDWVDEQPSWVKNALFENQTDPKSVIRVIDLYKSDTGQTKLHKKRDEEDAASDVNPKSKTTIDAGGDKGTFKESQVQKMSDKQYAEAEDAIMEAMRTGKFVYDVSGYAR